MPQVSVIIPTYNGAQFVGETIESVLTQTLPDIEVIIVNDGSTDHTAKVLERYGGRIRVLSNERNVGIAASRNIGVSASRGRYVSFLDHDDLWKAEKTARQLDVFERYPQVGFCFTDYEFFGEPVRFKTGFEENGNKIRTLSAEEILPNVFLLKSDYLFIEMVNGKLPCWTSTVMMRRSSLDRVGGFDEELLINDDTQMWLRFTKQVPMAYLVEPWVRQRVRASSTSSAMTLERKHRDSLHMFDTLEKWLSLGFGEIEAVRARQAALWWAVGYLDFANNHPSRARVNFRKSLQSNFSRQAFWYYLLSFLPASLMQPLRALKQELFGSAVR